MKNQLNGRAIGMVELKTVSSGIMSVDAMVKTSSVDIVEAQTVCPGKYIAIVTGDISAVAHAVETVQKQFGHQLINSIVLGNPHAGILPAIYGTSEIEAIRALGILETYDVASILVAADLAAKTAVVDLIELRLAKGMCGKSYMLLTGEVAAVEAAVRQAEKAVGENGMMLDSSIIAQPDAKTCQAII